MNHKNDLLKEEHALDFSTFWLIERKYTDSWFIFVKSALRIQNHSVCFDTRFCLQRLHYSQEQEAIPEQQGDATHSNPFGKQASFTVILPK